MYEYEAMAGFPQKKKKHLFGSLPTLSLELGLSKLVEKDAKDSGDYSNLSYFQYFIMVY